VSNPTHAMRVIPQENKMDCSRARWETFGECQRGTWRGLFRNLRQPARWPGRPTGQRSNSLQQDQSVSLQEAVRKREHHLRLESLEGFFALFVPTAIHCCSPPCVPCRWWLLSEGSDSGRWWRAEQALQAASTHGKSGWASSWWQVTAARDTKFLVLRWFSVQWYLAWEKLVNSVVLFCV